MKAVPTKRKPESASLSHALYGLALPASVLRALQKRGIYCIPGISVEHQHLAKRYVLRGVESGGADFQGVPSAILSMSSMIATRTAMSLMFENALTM